MKHKIFLFNVILLIYLANPIASDAQSPVDNLPDGAIARFNSKALVYTVAFSPDGQLLASGGDDNAVILWNVADGSEREVFTEHSKSVTSVMFSPNGQLLASASLDGFVRLWYVSAEHQRNSLRHSDWIESVAFSPNGKVLASSGGDQEGSVTLWDVRQKRRIATLPGHRSLVESVAFSPDGQLLASASRDRTIKFWDVDSQYMRKTLAGHKNVVHAVAFSPDGKTLASSSRDNTIKLWEVSSGTISATFEIRNNLYAYAESIAFSPDGQLLAAACVDYTIRLWNTVNYSEAAVLTGHHGGVTSVAFSPDGRRLASGSRDRTVLLWDLSHFGFEVPPITDVPEGLDPPEVAVENPPIVNRREEPEPAVSEIESLPGHQDTTPPDIAIHSSMERTVDSTVRNVPVKVSVTDDSRIAKVQINSTIASVLDADAFRATIPLNQGENEIRIIATDAHGNMGTHRFIIVRGTPDYVDTTPPEIAIDLHSTNQTADQFTVEGSITDDTDIAEVWVNDVEVQVSEAGTFIATVPLNRDKSEIRITATDVHGNMGTSLFTDTEGPDIHINSPIGNAERGFRSAITISAASTFVSGAVTDPSGVAEVKINNIEAQITEGSFNETVQLDYGNNIIKVTAIDTQGNQSSKEITIRRPDLSPSQDPVRIGTDYALLFAVNTYDYWPQLMYPRVDALDIKQVLEGIYGFQVELIENPTKIDVHRVLREYVQKEYAPEDQLLIFFAGHGDFDEVTNMGYLVSQDTEKPEDDSFRTTYFSHSDFRDIIDGMSCEHIFLVMDTCYSGTFDRRIAMRGEAEDVYNRSLSQADIEQRLRYMTRWYLTSGANERVPDDSLFARAFLDALRSEGGNDNILTIQEILPYFERLSDPEPCYGEFGRNEKWSDFLFIKK